MPQVESDGLKKVMSDKLQHREAQAEMRSCLLFTGAISLIFIVLSATGEAQQLHSYTYMRAAFVVFISLLILLAIIIARGWWHSGMRYAGVALQVTALSALLISVGRDKGAAFALSTAVPMLYCLVISITAFRLSPWLSIFSGALAAGELILSYGIFLRPAITPEILATNPTLAWPAVFARVIVLLTIGLACALAAKNLRHNFKQSSDDQSRIALLERTFGRLVAPEVAQRILEDENWMRPARRDAVIMFADLKGFTSYSENRSPEEVAEFLNRCWSIAANIVEKHGGVINKYMGDGFLAIFGVPLELANAEEAAALTAHDLQSGLAPILEPVGLAVCVGVHAGPLIVGGIGSEERCEFTVIGSTVNLASRIETLNRSLSTNCLTSQPVAQKIAEAWHLKDHGGQRVKGVADEVGVYELLGKKPSES